jgi:hypothetical protein
VAVVIKEWRCKTCGLDFDSSLQICERCGASGDFVERVFRTAPGFKSDVTKATDNSLQRFCETYGINYTNNQSQKHEVDLSKTWHDPKEVISAPDPDESRADVVKSLMKEAGQPVTSRKIVVNPNDKMAAAGVA